MNALLDRAEDPEKLLKLMIREMEDTLVELKSSCAQAMAVRTRVSRSLDEANERAQSWASKAKLAVDKGREELAREALMEKRVYTEKVGTLEQEITQHEQVVEQYRSDIQQLEEKLDQARDKQRILLQRHTRAQRSKASREQAERARSADAMLRFDKFEQRIERMEADADMAGRISPNSLEDEFAKLALDDDIEKELSKLREGSAKNSKS